MFEGVHSEGTGGDTGHRRKLGIQSVLKDLGAVRGSRSDDAPCQLRWIGQIEAR